MTRIITRTRLVYGGWSGLKEGMIGKENADEV